MVLGYGRGHIPPNVAPQSGGPGIITNSFIGPRYLTVFIL